jgi:protein AbiQ
MKNIDFVKMLDSGNTNKQSKRTHLCVMIEVNSNKFYVPLRNNLGDEVRKFGRIGHAVPSNKRKNAGLDYRYALIINDESYIELQTEKKIPEIQYRKIKNDYETIKAEFKVYINGYIKAAKKNRVVKEPLYRESCLINFEKELNLKM